MPLLPAPEPQELNNLALNKEYAGLLKEMKGKMSQAVERLPGNFGEF